MRTVKSTKEDATACCTIFQHLKMILAGLGWIVA
jgi:hypothetical protein